jgi:hypothetical protein
MRITHVVSGLILIIYATFIDIKTSVNWMAMATAPD